VKRCVVWCGVVWCGVVWCGVIVMTWYNYERFSPPIQASVV
jgi:hypothetical protein